MTAPDYAGLIKAVRVDGEDSAVAAVRYVEDDAGGGTLYLRLATDLPDGGVELVDADGGVLCSAPDVQGGRAAGAELEIGFGAASAPATDPKQVPNRETPASAPAGTSDAVPSS